MKPIQKFGDGRILLTSLLLFPAVLILLYNVYAGVGIHREEQSRLSAAHIQQQLGAVEHPGNHTQPAVLMLHGFGGSPNDLRPLFERLSANYPVHVPLLPGHGGRSPRDLAAVTAADWRATALRHAHELAATHDRLIVCGFSLGGLLALEVAESVEVEAVILINPYTTVPYHPLYLLPPRWWTRMTAGLIPYVRKLAAGRINDPDGRKRYEPSYLHLAQQTCRELDAYSAGVTPANTAYSCPIYLHLSMRDVVSSPRQMQQLADSIHATDVQIHRWTNSNHVLLYDYDGEAASTVIVQQIERIADS